MTELFSESLTFYYDRAFDNARARVATLPCDSFIGKTDEETARDLVADAAIEIPALVEGDPATDLIDDRAEYAHRVVNHASLKFKPDRLLVAYAGYARERLDGDRYVVTVRREPGMKPRQAREQYEDRMKMFRENLDALAAQIKQGNMNLPVQLQRFVADRRQECEEEANFRSGM